GQGIYIKFLSKALADAGHEVDVISGPPYPELDSRVKLIRLPSLNLFATDNHIMALRPRHLLSYTDLYEWLSMATGGFAEPYTFGRRLERYFQTHRPAYDIVHDNQSLSYGTLALQRLGLPLVTTIHHPITSDLDIALKQADSWRLRLLIRRWHSFLGMQKKVARQLDHLVTVSAASRQDIASAFNLDPARIQIIHNGIDTNVFTPNEGDTGEPDTIMTTASADAPLKGLGYLLAAFARLKQSRPGLRLLLLGKLKKDGDTEKLIDSLGIRADIEFHSSLASEEVAALYRRAQVAVVPSIYEGFGLPAGEAMACGLPVIATNGGALPEVVGDAGILVPVRDQEAIAKALARLLDSPAERRDLATAARQRILEHFSWDLAARKMTGLYHDIAKQSLAA
ncbi:MAG: glycosyltransferase family 4 protein, partial [Pseudomonadales bacterium]